MGPHYTTQLAEWVIGFRDYGPHVWYTRLMRDGFRHCFSFTFDPESNVWIVVDPTLNGSYIRAFSPDQFSPLLDLYTKTGCRFVKISAVKTTNLRFKFLLTCVSIVKHILGVKSCAVTPYQLYRYLLKIGAKPIFEA